jgi:hypothetical protein
LVTVQSSSSPRQLQTVFGEDQVQTMSRQSDMAPPDFQSQLSQHLPRVSNDFGNNVPYTAYLEADPRPWYFP